MKRSVIRGLPRSELQRWSLARSGPDYASIHPGYNRRSSVAPNVGILTKSPT